MCLHTGTCVAKPVSKLVFPFPPSPLFFNVCTGGKKKSPISEAHSCNYASQKQVTCEKKLKLAQARWVQNVCNELK